MPYLRLAIKHFKSSSSCCLQLDQGEGKATIGTSISSLLNPPERLVGYHQPHLVCIGQPNATAHYVIVAEKDKVAIPLEDNGLSFAIDKLFKMIWMRDGADHCHHKYLQKTATRDASELLLLVAKDSFLTI
ncbi:hypothetical protein N1851_002136 [Merluccius polli]|uniref:Uncharacterized protein n=1 Tax=Merluccius polli TaxID=89951 RepID=A0AA47NC60_MERPO|nr:hypothetical protein N1851_002136 [Merluccius polli]